MNTGFSSGKPSGLPDEINTHPQQPAGAHLICGQLQIGDIQYELAGSASSSVVVAPAVAAAVPRQSPVERSTLDCLDTGFVVLPPMLQLEDLPDENEYTLIGDPYRGETVTASRETAATKSKAAGAP